jgi:hypothetical protein
MGDISKGVANTLLPAKNIYNEKCSRTNIGVMEEVGEKHGYVSSVPQLETGTPKFVWCGTKTNKPLASRI